MINNCFEKKFVKKKKQLQLIASLALLLAFLISSPAFAAEMVLNYALTEKHVPTAQADKKKSKPTQSASTKRVVLGSGFFSVKEKSLERIYDFKNRRIHYLNHQSKTHAEISLFSDLAFRIAELQTRIQMAEAVQRAGEAGPDNLYTLESLFGLEGEKPRVTLTEEKSKAGGVVLLDQGEKVAEMDMGKDTPQVDTALFGRFLIYDHSLHPLIRRRILSETRAPKTFRYYLQNLISQDEFVVELKKFESRSDRGFKIPANYKRSSNRPGALPESAALDGLIQSVRAGKSKLLQHPQSWYWDAAQASVAEKDYLNAAIYYLEYGLQSGDQAQVTEAMQKIAVYQTEGSDLDRFLRSLGVSGKEQAARAIEELQKLDRAKIKRSHVLDLVIANQKAVLGQYEDAAQLLIAALKKNPYLAGAYKDLGDLFYGQLDMSSAWLCWDFARELEPRHFMLEPISDYEKELLKNYPDFF